MIKQWCTFDENAQMMGVTKQLMEMFNIDKLIKLIKIDVSAKQWLINKLSDQRVLESHAK